MNWVDLLVIALVFWFTFAAFHAGLIREVVTIIGAVFAVVLASLFYTELAVDIEVAIDNERTARVIAFAIIFGAVVLASQLLALFLKQAASLLMLGVFDSLGGAVIGFVKGLIFVQVAIFVAITFPSLGFEDAIRNSALAPIFIDLIPFLRVILPNEFRNAIDSF